MSAAARDPFIAEILGQPAALRRAGAAVAEQTGPLAAMAAALEPARRERRPPVVLLTAMGGSLEACRALLPMLAAAQVLAVEIETAELVNARRGSLRGADLVVLVSQSGRSAEALRLADALARVTRPALAVVTNSVPNLLAERAGIVLETRAGTEEAPSTGSFAASLVVLDAVAAVLGGAAAADAAEVAAVAAETAAVTVERALAEPEIEAAAWRDWLGDGRALVVLGRGVAASAAGMGALLMKEATTVAAEAMSGAAFRHGPLEQAGPGLAIAVVALDPATTAFDAALAGEAWAAGSPIAWVGQSGTAPAAALAHDVPALAGPMAVIPAMVPFQLLAWRLAHERGEPGTFTLAGKVTVKE